MRYTYCLHYQGQTWHIRLAPIRGLRWREEKALCGSMVTANVDITITAQGVAGFTHDGQLCRACSIAYLGTVASIPDRTALLKAA